MQTLLPTEGLHAIFDRHGGVCIHWHKAKAMLLGPCHEPVIDFHPRDSTLRTDNPAHSIVRGVIQAEQRDGATFSTPALPCKIGPPRPLRFWRRTTLRDRTRRLRAFGSHPYRASPRRLGRLTLLTDLFSLLMLAGCAQAIAILHSVRY